MTCTYKLKTIEHDFLVESISVKAFINILYSTMLNEGGESIYKSKILASEI